MKPNWEQHDQAFVSYSVLIISYKWLGASVVHTEKSGSIDVVPVSQKKVTQWLIMI